MSKAGALRAWRAIRIITPLVDQPMHSEINRWSRVIADAGIRKQ